MKSKYSGVDVMKVRPFTHLDVEGTDRARTFTPFLDMHLGKPIGRILVLFLATGVLGGSRELRQQVPVTIVTIPWASASLNGGTTFVTPNTVILEPGEYRLVVRRNGFVPVERTLAVVAGGPQHHLVRMARP